MIHLILFEPEIPGNTGNIIRLCANTGCQLHLIKPLGFSLEDKMLRRAGLDYHEWATLRVWDDLSQCLVHLAACGVMAIYPITTKGITSPFDVAFPVNIALLFGPETRGLPEAVRALFPVEHWLRLPMLPNSRSLNLSNCAAVVVYAAWHKLGCDGQVY